MTQVSQGIRSTKFKDKAREVISEEEDQQEDEESTFNDSVNELNIRVIHKSKLYTDDTGRFPVKSRAGNQCIMIGYHSSNLILAQPFVSRKDKHTVRSIIICNRIFFWSISGAQSCQNSLYCSK